MDRLAGLVSRRAKALLLFASVFFVVGAAFAPGLADRLDPYGADDPTTESVIAKERLKEAGFRDVDVIVLVEDVPVRRPAGIARLKRIEKQVKADPDVASVLSFASRPLPSLVARDGNATYLTVDLKQSDDAERIRAAERIDELFADEPGVRIGGDAIAASQVNAQIEQDLRTAELLSFPLLFLLSLLFFRSLVAAALPLLVGALTIVGAFLILRIASDLISISVFSLNLVIGLALGLAIDYSLFIVSRYREEIAKEGPGLPALRRTLATAGRTVLFSALTIAGALVALMIFPQRFIYSMGVGGFCAALLAAATALVVLPAALALLGERVNALSPNFLKRRAERDAHELKEGFWYRLAQLEMRFPGRIAFTTGALLIALGIPFFSINFTSVDAQALPNEASARQVDSVLRTDFPPNRSTPVSIVVEGGPREVRRIARAAAQLPGAAAVAPPVRLREGVRELSVISKAPPLEDSSQDLVRDLRALPGDAQVTGVSAAFIDLKHSLVAHLPLALTIVILTTMVTLFLMTGSVVLPIKQVLMNVLGLSAVFGILVLVFQDGRFESLLGYTSDGGIEATQPIVLMVLAFGLSTDYGVFLLSRIRESWLLGHSNSESVAIGLERTGRIVTSAALLLAVAVGAFVTSEIALIKQVGLGAALAVLIDATIIRALLVPSLMALLGKWNWWAPGPLRRLHDRIGISETADDLGPPPPAERTAEPAGTAT